MIFHHDVPCVETRIETIEVTREVPIYNDSRVEVVEITKEIPCVETRVEAVELHHDVPCVETRKFKPDVNLIAQSYKAATIKSIL